MYGRHRDLWWTVTVAGFLTVAAFLVYPLVTVLVTSFSGEEKRFVLAANYERFFTLRYYYLSIVISLYLSTLATLSRARRWSAAANVYVVTLFALNPDQAWPEWQRFIKVQVMVLFMLMLLVNRERIDMTVAVIAASICFYGVKGGIFTILGGGQYMVWGPPRSFIAGNTEIGFALVITVPLLWYLRSIATQRWVRIACVAAFGLCLISILGS